MNPDYRNDADRFAGRCPHRRKAFRCRYDEGHEGNHGTFWEDGTTWFEWDEEGREVEPTAKHPRSGVVRR